MILSRLRGLSATAALLACASAASGAEAAPTNPAPKPPADAPVTLQKVEVKEQATGAEASFAGKAATDSLVETVSGAALKNPNAQTSTDLLKDVSGVSVNKGADGSSKVSVRGLDQRLLRITVDGQRQGGAGNALDSIPPEIVQSLEVTKSFTPDMEADAVGGVINVNTGGNVIKNAYEQGRHQLSFNALEPRLGTRNSLTLARPFRFLAEKPNASVLLTSSFEDAYKRRERVSTRREWPAQVSPGPAPFTAQAIPVLTQPLIESTLEHRQRTGLVANADARLGETALFVRANLSRDWANRNRDYDDTNPAAGTPVALTPTSATFSGVTLSRRNQQQVSQRDAANFSVGGKTHVGHADLDATLAYTRTHESEPRTLDSGARTDRTYRVSYDLAPNAFAPVYTRRDETNAADLTSGDDPARYRVDYLQIAHSDLRDEEMSAKFNAKLSRGGSTAKADDYMKFGGKLQQRHRVANLDRDVYGAGSTPRTLAGLVGTPWVALKTVGYAFGSVPSGRALADLLSASPGALKLDPTQTLINSSGGDYTATETVGAAYGMGRVRLGETWTLLGGARVEDTRITSKANQMNFDATGRLTGFTPAHAVNDYTEFLPGLHLRHEPKPGLLFRGSITRSLSRPNYADVAPYRTLSFIDHRSRVGNPGLQPYQATNFDFSIDRYSDKHGLFSLALFYKKIDHFIADAQDPVQVGNLGQFIEFRRINGDSALAMGLEANWQSPTWELPSTLGRGSVVANYSYNHGEAHYPTRPGEKFPLPDQVIYQGSLSFHVERKSLTLDWSMRYKTKWWEDLIAPGFDNYLKGAWDAEISGAYKLGKDTRVTAGITNLLNLPVRHYAGSLSRMNDSQRNGIDFAAGVQWKL